MSGGDVQVVDHEAGHAKAACANANGEEDDGEGRGVVHVAHRHQEHRGQHAA